MKNYQTAKADQQPGVEKMAFSVAEAVAVTGLGRTTLYTLMNSGQLRYCKIRERRVIRRSDLQDLFSAAGQPAPPAAHGA